MGVGSFFAAYVANDELVALERGETQTVLMPAPLIDLYEFAGRGWTVGVLIAFGALMLVVGVVSWHRERTAASRVAR